MGAEHEAAQAHLLEHVVVVRSEEGPKPGHRGPNPGGRMTQTRPGQSLSKIIFTKSDVYPRGDFALACLHLSLESAQRLLSDGMSSAEET